MSRLDTFKSWLNTLAFAACVVYPTVQGTRQFGTLGLAVYLVVATPAVFCAHRLADRKFQRMAPLHSLSCATAIFIFLSVAHFSIYPQIDVGGFTILNKQFGSADSDNALDQAVSEILQLRDPYNQRTFLDNEVVSLPGQMIFAFPFYIVFGNSGFQAIPWLVAFFLLVGRVFRSYGSALLLLLTLLVFSPIVPYSLMQGSDRLANSLYVTVLAYLFVDFASSKDRHLHFLLAVLLGIALASRINYALILPLIFSSLVRQKGLGFSIAFSTLIAIIPLLITLPFILLDPQGFTPVQSMDKIQFDSVVPFSKYAVPGIGLLLAIALALYCDSGTPRAFARNCLVTQAYLVLTSLIIASIHYGEIDWKYFGYGNLFMFFGFIAFPLGSQNVRTSPTCEKALKHSDSVEFPARPSRPQ